jgi:SAM-dependent methyltransferase
MTRFDIMSCPSCDFGHTFPRLSVNQLLRYYPTEYYSVDRSVLLEQKWQTRRYRKTRIQRIRRYVQSGLLLDIGCGPGMFLKTAKESGFETEGLEISPEAAQLGRKIWGLTIREGYLQEISFPADHYDVVTLWHVFEHLHNPVETAKQLHELTKRRGLLVVAVPNFASFQARAFRHRWFHLDVPRHLFHYSPSSLQRIIERVGFKTMEINYFSGEHNWAGILGSLMRLSPPGESLTHKAIRKILGAPLARGTAYLEALTGRGGTFELYAIKE